MLIEYLKYTLFQMSIEVRLSLLVVFEYFSTKKMSTENTTGVLQFARITFNSRPSKLSLLYSRFFWLCSLFFVKRFFFRFELVFEAFEIDFPPCNSI